MIRKRDGAWQQWIKSDECLEITEECAWSILRLIKKNKLPDENNLLQEDKSRAVSTIQGLIWIFLQEMDNEPQKKQWLEQIRKRNFSSLKRNIANKYRQLILDRQRKKDNSPWHACYRRARTAFDSHPSIRLVSQKRASFYSPMKEPVSLPCLSRLNPELWRTIPPPVEDAKRIRKKEVISAKGLDFWGEVASILNVKYHLALRIFINYLAYHYPLECGSREHVSAEDKLPSCKNGGERAALKDTLCGSDLPPEQMQTQLRLDELARDLAKKLDDHEKRILVCIYGLQMTKTQTAEKLGYSHAAGLTYPMSKLLEKIRCFLSLWPGLDGEFGDEEMAAEFLDMVVEICKKSVADRS